MSFVTQVIKEQFSNSHLIFRLATYDIKSSFQMHYLGILWQFLNPVAQVFVYWFVFGVGIRNGNPVGDVPFFVWLVIGLIPWFFISPTITQASNSVYSKVNLVSKMKFPVSVLPMITIIKNSFNFIVMFLILIVVLYFYGINPGSYLLQLPYYFFAMYTFLFSITLLFSTISTIVRDFQFAVQSTMRIMFFLTPILWDFGDMSITLQNVLKLNPFYYLIEGFRNTLLGESWFYTDLGYTLYFWFITMLMLTVGSILHIKFRNKFVDYL